MRTGLWQLTSMRDRLPERAIERRSTMLDTGYLPPMPLAVGGGFVAAGLYLLIAHHGYKGVPPADWPNWADQRSIDMFVTVVGLLLIAVAVSV
jgi:hypothetical protein